MVQLHRQLRSAWRQGRAEGSLETLLGSALEAVQLAHCLVQGSQFWHLDTKVFRLLLHSSKVVQRSAAHAGSVLHFSVSTMPRKSCKQPPSRLEHSRLRADADHAQPCLGEQTWSTCREHGHTSPLPSFKADLCPPAEPASHQHQPPRDLHPPPGWSCPAACCAQTAPPCGLRPSAPAAPLPAGARL